MDGHEEKEAKAKEYGEEAGIVHEGEAGAN